MYEAMISISRYRYPDIYIQIPSDIVRYIKMDNKMYIHVVRRNEMRVLYVDAGHGMDTSGKRTPIFTKGFFKGESIREFEFNRVVASEFSKFAKSEGYTIVEVYDKVQDEDISLSERSEKANRHYKSNVNNRNKAVFISFHYNAYDGKWGTNGGGYETHHHDKSTQGKKIANYIQPELSPLHNVNSEPMRDRGVKASNFHVLRETYMPAVLLECGFMDVYEEAMMMLDINFIRKVAKKVFVGIKKYFAEVDRDGTLDIPEINKDDIIDNLQNEINQLEDENMMLKKLLKDINAMTGNV